MGPILDAPPPGVNRSRRPVRPPGPPAPTFGPDGPGRSDAPPRPRPPGRRRPARRPGVAPAGLRRGGGRRRLGRGPVALRAGRGSELRPDPERGPGGVAALPRLALRRPPRRLAAE